MRNNLKEKSKTLIGITLKTINHNAIKVFFPNFCQNYAELKKLASNCTLPMIAINHKIRDDSTTIQRPDWLQRFQNCS